MSTHEDIPLDAIILEHRSETSLQRVEIQPPQRIDFSLEAKIQDVIYF